MKDTAYKIARIEGFLLAHDAPEDMLADLEEIFEGITHPPITPSPNLPPQIKADELQPGHLIPVPKKRRGITASQASAYRKNKQLWTAEKQAELDKLLQINPPLKKPEIARRLGVKPQQLYNRLNYLKMHPRPSITLDKAEETTDADGHKVFKCPPGYARGIAPQANVRPRIPSG